ncbi:TetR/AcrR family transcriptional regulator [Nocardia yunnanensis]|uniref:TetR/AcrR family transcriptional regulator n=1 Tax=Nocardia yunnanensis TaxID=2382165 RepID=A0A386ZIL2_9NOCA|nr:TetR/AcrR family transcriptional regulator [Nocardia yunnanensis]AYF77361.1 TetR/AcrR family transcriptional regulator [Nocardia yunnanensis]
MTGHVDRRSAALPAVTKADVREAALTLFAERGYHGTSLRDVANALGLRTPSLYAHIDSKQSLLAEIVAETLDQVVSEFDEVLARTSDPVEQVWEATRVYALHHATHRREALVVNQDTVHLDEPTLTAAQQLRRRHEHSFRQLIIDGTGLGVFTVAAPKLASFAIMEMCVSIARWFREDGDIGADEVARQYAGYALDIAGASRESRPAAAVPALGAPARTHD